MKTRFLFTILGATTLLFGAGTAAARPLYAPVGTAFTYQGRLTDGGIPANGAYDFQFNLYEVDVGDAALTLPVYRDDVTVADGLFTVQLDFGAVFDGSTRYLEIAVRPGSSVGAYTTLTPRQELTATPYALYSAVAPWSGLTGVPAGFADGIDNGGGYDIGEGLELISNTLSVNYTPGLPTAAARSTHDHWGQTWGGAGTGLTLNGTVYGLYSYGNAAGVSGTSVYCGVVGTSSGSGQGTAACANGDIAAGVYGTTDSQSGYGVQGVNTNASVGTGVRGQGTTFGVYGLGGTGVYGESLGNDPMTDFAGFFQGQVYIDGDLAVAGNLGVSGGTKSALVDTQDFGTRALYALESPESWFEDLGTAQLANGEAVVGIEPVFAETVNLADDYHVFVTALGDCALYVDTKSPASFTVRAMGGRSCSIAFDYRIVAKRLGYEDTRLAEVNAPAMEPAGK